MEESDGWIAEQISYWNTISYNYDSLYKSTWSNLENAQLLNQLKSLGSLKSSSHVLDLGCGTGLGYELCQSIAAAPFEYIGVDISPQMVSICRQKWSTPSFFVGNMSDLSRFPSGYFNTVLCLFTSFSFSDQPQKTLREIFRVTKDEGEIFVSLLSKYSLRRLIRRQIGNIEMYSTRYSSNRETAPAHVYSVSEVQRLFQQAGFSLRKIYGQGCFSGVYENPMLWSLDVKVSSFNTNVCHLMNVHAIKKG